MKLELSGQIFGEKAQISSFTKIRPVGAESFHANRQTDLTELIVAFRNFANAPKNAYEIFVIHDVKDQLKILGTDWRVILKLFL